MSLIESNLVPKLQPGEVQLWWMQATEEMARLGQTLLAADEIERSQQLIVPLARYEFLAARAGLRMLLGAMMGTAPQAIRFHTGVQGKPSVPGVAFNVSHSRGLVVIALCLDAEIGVDIEAIQSEIEAVDIARDSFSQEEIAEIESAVSVEQRNLCFYRIWTKKEAVLKADGNGLMKPLHSFSVSSYIQGEQEVLLDLSDMGTKYPRSFFVREVAIEGGFAGAIAVTQPGLVIQNRTLDARCFADWMQN